MRRHLASIRFMTVLILLSAALSSPLRAQETPPAPPPLPETPVEITATTEPTATSVPSETPTELPTETETPTLAPTESETPTALPTETATLTPESTATADVTATPEGTATAEATTEATVAVTPDFITATPELIVPTATDLPPTSIRRSGRIQSQLLELEAAVEAGNTAQAMAVAAAQQLDVDTAVQQVHIEVIAADAAEAARLRPLVEGLGGTFVIGYDRRLEFHFPITQLDVLGRTRGSFVVFEPQEAQPMLGPRTSEGVQVTGAAQWHQRGYNGAGVRIGVIDRGFLGYPSPETTGCGVAISNFAAGTTLTNQGDHGTSVVEIICDMAPKAQVYIAQVTTISSVNAAVDWLIAQNVNIINMSMSLDFAGAGDGTGEVNRIIQRAIDAGILWVNAAGNGNGDTWSDAYTNVTSPADLNPTELALFPTPDWHDFGGGNVVAELFGGLEFDCIPGSAIFVDVTLRWNDWNAERTGNQSAQDYDIYIFKNSNGGDPGFWEYAFAASFFDQSANNAATPVESVNGLAFCDSQNTRFGVGINLYNGTPDEFLYLQTNSAGPLQFATPNISISSPADSEDVVTVAAGEVKVHPDGWPFSPLGYPDLAVYSSRGPILGPSLTGGTNPTSSPPEWDKPDVTGPTNVLTSRDTAFNGTSAASPHVAGFAALVYQFNRAAYDALSGNARAMAVKDDLLDPNFFMRTIPASSSTYAYCNVNPLNCFGQGVITINNDFFTVTDALLQHTDGRVLRSGAGWTQQTQAGASGGNYIYTKGQNTNTDNFAQIQLGVTYASGVQVFYWQRPDFDPGGGLQIIQEGVGDVTGSAFFSHGNSLFNATPRLVSFTLNLSPYIGLHEITIRPNASANGLSMDYVQLLHDPVTIPTLQENQLTTFGTWSRVALANTSGGYHMTNNQRGAGVQFFTGAAEFTVTYTKRPDGGIMEIWVNGQLCAICGEINTWSGSTMTGLQAVHYVNAAALSPTFGAPPYHVQLINSGRQTPATTNRPYVTIDNIRFPAGNPAPPAPQAIEAEAGYTGQVGSQFLPMNGVWTNLAQASAFGGRIFNTTTAGAEFRFRSIASQHVIYYTGLNTGALVDIYVNGQLCTACGRIDTYRATTMYKIPYYLDIPGSPPFHVTLRNTGTRSSGSGTTATMGIDRIESLDASFTPLNLFNVQGADSGSFSINERWVANRQTDAIGTDVYVNNSPYGALFAATCSRDFTLLLGKNPNGGTVRVKLWDDRDADESNWHYITLAEFNGQASSTLWRYGLNVSIPTTTFGGGCPYTNGIGTANRPFQILIEVDSNTQFGSTLDYGYVDAMLVNDNGAMFGWSYDTTGFSNFEMYSNGVANGDRSLLEIGPGWQNVPDNTGTFAGAQTPNAQFARRTNQTTGASIQFTIAQDSDPSPDPDDNPRPRLVFTRAPDGGIAEVFINGIFQYEISFYSPVIVKRQFLTLVIPANTKYPAVVELRNVPRRTTGSTGYYLYMDALIETSEPTGFATPIIGTGTQQNSPNIQLFGATWTNSSNPPTTTVFPSGGSIATTTANTGGVRFILTGSNRFSFVSSTSANRGIAEIWVNGRLCTACGTINTFRAQTFWRVPFLVEIPTVTFGAGPYYVEIHTTNMRSTGATGFGLSADEIIPHGGTIVASGDPLWTAIVDGQLSGGNGYNSAANWPTINSAFAYGSSYRRTTIVGADYSFDLSVNNDELVILRNTGTTGGVAEIWIHDAALGDLYHCYECGTMINYSPYTRYQVPFYFQVPSRFTPDDNNTPGVPGDDFWYIQIENTPLRVSGAIGNELSLDAFILLP